jgi:hypothetical protein
LLAFVCYSAFFDLNFLGECHVSDPFTNHAWRPCMMTMTTITMMMIILTMSLHPSLIQLVDSDTRTPRWQGQWQAQHWWWWWW